MQTIYSMDVLLALSEHKKNIFITNGPIKYEQFESFAHIRKNLNFIIVLSPKLYLEIDARIIQKSIILQMV